MLKLNHIKFLLAAIAISFSNMTFAQFAGMKVMDLPEILLMPTGFDSDMIKNSEVITGRPWRVFSDQSINTSFEKANRHSNIKNSSLDFMEDFLIIEMKGDYLHLVKDQNLSPDNTLSSFAVDYGWVNIENLLLSKHCLVAVTGNIARKVLLIDQNRYKSKDDKTISNFFFVFKEDEGSYLIGLSNRILPGMNPKEIIIGWISTEEIIEWNTRIVFEPNNDIMAINERREKHIEPVLFINEKDAINYGKNKKTKGSKGIKIKRQNGKTISGNVIGAWNRLPLLAENERLIELGFINDYNSSLSRGYTVSYFNNLTHPLYSKTLLLSRLELGELINNLQRLLVTPGDRQRQRLLEVWINILRKQGGSIDEEQLLNTSMERVTEILFEIPTSNTILKGLKLKDITDNEKISKEDLIQLFEIFEHKLNILESRIYNNDNFPNKFYTNDEVYYWISESYLP